jgi:hypothetical protein
MEAKPASETSRLKCTLHDGQSPNEEDFCMRKTDSSSHISTRVHVILTYINKSTCDLSYSPMECTNKTGWVEKQWTIRQGQIALLDWPQVVPCNTCLTWNILQDKSYHVRNILHWQKFLHVAENTQIAQKNYMKIVSTMYRSTDVQFHA